MKKGLFVFDTDNVNQSLVNLYQDMVEDNFELFGCFLRNDILSLHSIADRDICLLEMKDVYPLSQFDFIICGRNCYGGLDAKELIDYAGIIYTDDTAFYEGRSVYGDIVFVNGDFNYQNINEVVDSQIYKVGCLKGSNVSITNISTWSNNQKYTTKVLYIESGHYPFGYRGRRALSNAISMIVLENPDCEFVVKPRFLIGEAEVAKHKNEDYLYYYIKKVFGDEWPDNLKWLDTYISLDSLISEADVVMHTYSSAHAQAALMGKRIINLTDVQSEETADFRTNRFRLIKRIIDQADNNVSIFNIGGCVKNSKKPSEDYIEHLGVKYTRPQSKIIEHIKLGSCENYENRKKGRLKGYFYFLLSKSENRFDDFDYFIIKMNEKLPFLYEIISNTDECIRYISEQVNRIEAEYIMENWHEICENPFNRAYALNVLNRTQNEFLMAKMLNEAYRFNAKDASYYYYATVYWINKKNQTKAMQNAREYLELTKNNLYERLDSEREECINFIKGVFIK